MRVYALSVCAHEFVFVYVGLFVSCVCACVRTRAGVRDERDSWCDVIIVRIVRRVYAAYLCRLL